MIDEKKLIQDIWKCSSSLLNDWDTAGILRIIGRQPKVGEWIPCSERLPEDEKTKLVTLSDGKVEGAFWNERNWWCMGDSINLETRTEDVIAWMPLPAPYNAERGGKNE